MAEGGWSAAASSSEAAASEYIGWCLPSLVCCEGLWRGNGKFADHRYTYHLNERVISQGVRGMLHRKNFWENWVPAMAWNAMNILQVSEWVCNGVRIPPPPPPKKKKKKTVQSFCSLGVATHFDLTAEVWIVSQNTLRIRHIFFNSLWCHQFVGAAVMASLCHWFLCMFDAKSSALNFSRSIMPTMCRRKT